MPAVFSSPDILHDGNYLAPKKDGQPRYEYPFRKNGDRVTALFEQDYIQAKATFFPQELKTPWESDPTFRLIAESEPRQFIADLYKFTRTYSRLPTTQVVPGSRFIAKPELSGDVPTVINGVLVTQPDPNIAEYLFYSQTPVTADTGVPGVAAGGGTFTLSFDGDTTAALAYNADAATIQTALNGLASVIAYGSVAVTGSAADGFTITWNPYVASSVDASSLTATGATIFIPSGITTGMTQRVVIQPIHTSGNYSATSSVTPSYANPLLTSGGTTAQAFKIYSYASNNVNATGGTFTITAFGQTTAPIAWNASLADIKAALDLLSEIDDRGGALVTGVPLNTLPFGAVTIFTAGAPALTGGTFTLTVLGQTTAGIAYNASLATIQAAINLLSNVTARGGVVVGGAGFAGGKQDFTITFANIPPITGSGASLTPSTTSMAVAAESSQGLVNTVDFRVSAGSSRLLTAASHGITTADAIIVTMGGSNFDLAAGTFEIPDANTVKLTPASGILATAGTATAVGTATDNTYVADTPNVPVKLTTYFYLPGITPGIDSADDIPLPARGTPSQLLGAIFSGATTFNYEVGELTQWRDSPILMLTVTTVNPTNLT